MNDLPPAFVARMHELLGTEVDALIAALEAPAVRGGRLNPRCFASVPELGGRVGAALDPAPWHPDGFISRDDTPLGAHPLHAAGAFYLQEPSATLAVVALAARPGEAVLDLCAAPGGKATAVAAAMRGEGLLLANDVQPRRARALATTLDRWGNANAVVTNESPLRLAAHFGAFFDRVLVDAPCSGEGRFRRDPTARRQWDERAVVGCARRQTEILEQAQRLVRPEGTLVYCTCTFEEAENEGVVREFLASHDGWTVEPVAATGGAVEGTLAGTVRVHPHRAAGEGQFVARLRAPAGAPARPRRARHPRLPPLAAAAWDAFAASTLGGWAPPGPLLHAGDLVSARAPAPALDGLAVIRPGLPLGWVRHRRFEPATALAHVLDGGDTTSVELTGDALASYLAGSPAPVDGQGWVLVTTADVPLGWGRAQRGVLRSRFPASWRHWVRAPRR